MTLLMTFKPDQSLNQVADQTGVEQSLVETEVPPNTGNEERLEATKSRGQFAESFEPEFDGDLKNVSWASLKLFEKSEDF